MDREDDTVQRSKPSSSHWRYFGQKPFLRADRERTTVLFGGLTWKHERLMRGVFRAMGYRAEIIPTPTVVDFQTGKEYANYGQCSPLYFTAGSLVNYLKKLERDGLTRQEIVDGYVYITPESPCGPCRLGMYQNEYRLVTENAGFPGFRVIPMSQHPRFVGNGDEGFELNTDLSLGLVFAVLMGDVVNDSAYSIRPFEINAGETDRVAQEAITYLEGVMAGLSFPELNKRSRCAAFAAKMFPRYRRNIEVVLKVHRWLKGAHLKCLLGGLRRVAERFDAIEVDRTRLKPVVKIIGEFWDQMTEGDGNYEILRFLEKEGSQLLIEPVAAWFHLMIQWARQHNNEYSPLVAKNYVDITLIDRLRANIRWRIRRAIIAFIDKTYRQLYQQMRTAMLDLPRDLVSQIVLEGLARPYYHSGLDAGEAHTEVAKNIYYHSHSLAHMVLSLKPFGCLPSTQSDAVQAAVQGAYGEMIFLPIETSGEGKVNALSRVQMALGEAKQKAQKELERAFSETGLTLEVLQQVIKQVPELKRPSTQITGRPDIVGVAAQLVYYVSNLIQHKAIADPRTVVCLASGET